MGGWVGGGGLGWRPGQGGTRPPGKPASAWWEKRVVTFALGHIVHARVPAPRRSRVEMSQDPKTAMPAAAAADEIAAVVNASLLPTAEPAGVADYALNKLLDLGGWAVSALGRGSSDGGASIGAPSTGAPSTAGSIDGDSVAEGPPVWRARPPPGWFLAGGNARQFWLIGVAQKLLPSGWPSNGLLAKKFGLSRPLQ